MEVDLALANELIEQYSFFDYVEEAHEREHSLEVQLPFLQYRLHKPFKIVPIIMGTRSASMCQKIADALKPYFNSRNLFVVSSDFSHYPDYEGAKDADSTTGAAIASNSPDAFLKSLEENESKGIHGLATSACGWSSILTLLDLSSQVADMKVENVCYQNSGDSRYGDKLRVVGYHAFAFIRPQVSGDSEEMFLSNDDKKILLQLARQSIEEKLGTKKPVKVDESQFSASLNMPCGAFVTLHNNKKLRGCIGHLQSDKPLWKTVWEMAWAAALLDSRFEQVDSSELNYIDIEISVLTPLKRIQSIDEFELGRDGILMEKDGRHGTLLPQVADKTNWTKIEFLEQCAKRKAGIGKDGWQTAELYTYQAIVFSEHEILEAP